MCLTMLWPDEVVLAYVEEVEVLEGVHLDGYGVGQSATAGPEPVEWYGCRCPSVGTRIAHCLAAAASLSSGA